MHKFGSICLFIHSNKIILFGIKYVYIGVVENIKPKKKRERELELKKVKLIIILNVS